MVSALMRLQLLKELAAPPGLGLVGSLDVDVCGPLLWDDDSGEINSAVATVWHMVSARACSADRKLSHHSNAAPGASSEKRITERGGRRRGSSDSMAVRRGPIEWMPSMTKDNLVGATLGTLVTSIGLANC